ncbi:isochorismatase family protein [Dickeya lacustris]|uniref:Isochorismatase family protein n=1 Tax=Dickeya lacustris TaxID=2259638 RepID=A0ABY8G7K5_9GAMM|nr:isochorismatase family protein [Dickeya lacustris]WFN55954.1 isochorismatase family protein [Dickeya lacustris]
MSASASRKGIGYYPVDSIGHMRQLLAHYRASGWPVIHIHHHTPAAGSALEAGSVAAQPVDGFAPQAGEPVFIKQTSSAFSQPDVLPYLQAHRLNAIQVIGAVAGFCVNSTVRAGADAGFAMTVVSDAVISFDLASPPLAAQNLHEVTLGLLGADFARVTTTEALLRARETA